MDAVMEVADGLSLEDDGQRAIAMGLTSVAFIAFNLGLRIRPFSGWIVNLLRQDGMKIGKFERRMYIHGAAHRITSHIHNMVAIPLGILALLDGDLFADPMYATSNLGTLLTIWSAAYFLHDLLVCCIWFDQAGIGFFMHALLCCSMYTYGVFYQQLHFFAAAFITWELSTPFVQLRWFLYEMGLRNTRLYVINGVAMMVTFFLARLFFGSYFSYVFWTASQAELEDPKPYGFQPTAVYCFRVANICLMGLNSLWFYKMVKGALQLLVRPRRALPGANGQAAAKDRST